MKPPFSYGFPAVFLMKCHCFPAPPMSTCFARDFRRSKRRAVERCVALLAASAASGSSVRLKGGDFMEFAGKKIDFP